MLTLITGAPGSGKSAATVDLLARFAAEGRAIYVNGIPDLKVGHVELSDDQMREWPQHVPDGAVVVVDEAQRIWPAASAGSRVGGDLAALNTHRHRGLDFVVVTQFPKLLHVNVRAVCGRHVHLRDVGILGRWWYEWPEASDVGTFKSAPVKRRYKLPAKAFALYKSASLHVKPVRSIPPALFIGAGALVGFVVLAWTAYNSISAKVNPPPKPAAMTLAPVGVGNAASGSRATVAPAAAAAPVLAEARPEVAGCINFGGRCSCFSRDGWPVIVEWEMCERSSRGFGGVVALDMAPAKAGVAAVAASAVQTGAAMAYQWDAGDFRQRAPLPHVR